MTSPLSEHQRDLGAEYARMFRSEIYQHDRWEGFTNFGLFENGIADQAAASRNLADSVIALLDLEQAEALDVGCGLGGPTRRLGERFGAGNVHGINISEYQIERCRENTPGATFHLMPAERMNFPNHHFDAVISVEAAPHFQGRREFLAEAARVLRPGGQIAVADFLLHAQPDSFPGMLERQEIYADLAAYRAIWEEAGFVDVRVRDVTEECWRGYYRALRAEALRDHASGTDDAARFTKRLGVADHIARLPMTAYVLVRATRP